MLALSLRDVMSFFAAFEKALSQIAPPGLMESTERDVIALLNLFENYSGCKFELKEWDYSTAATDSNLDSHAERETPEAIWSIIVNYGKHAVIVVNDMQFADGVPLVNYCYRRFLAIKEAYHVILRDEFARQGLQHPDSNTPERLTTAIDDLAFLGSRFSMVDFDSPDYPDTTKIENAAELLSILTLYPLDDMAADRAAFTGEGGTQAEDPRVIASSTLEIAFLRRVPQHYVDVLFRWHRFDELYLLHKQFRDGY
jgi:hypothetical protein